MPNHHRQQTSFRQQGGQFVQTLRRISHAQVTKMQQVTGVESGVESDMANDILAFLKEAVLAKKDIALKLGKSKPTRYLNDLVSKMADVGLIEYTIPDKPGSRFQKFRITTKGKAWLDARNSVKRS